MTVPAAFIPLAWGGSVIVGVNLQVTRTDPAGFAGQQADARAALGCGALGAHLPDVRPAGAPAVPQHLVDAVRLDGFRVPADPTVARLRLCG